MIKKKKIIIALIITLIITSISIIQLFAENIDELEQIPNDLSENEYILGTTETKLTKLYIKIRLNGTTIENEKIYANIKGTYDLQFIRGYTTYIRIGFWVNSTTKIFTSPYYAIRNITDNTIYLPMFIYNDSITSIEIYDNTVTVIGIYYSILDDPNAIANELYRQGYNAGYQEGLQHDIEEYTNITGYVEQLLTQFVGSDNARYITPIAIVLVVLFVYFLFIRFLLSMIKAKGVIKTCDITMLVACIILLVVMYSPMLNLTIKTENVGTTQIEQTETVQLEQRNIYIYDENGNIIGDIYNGITKTTRSEFTTELPDDISTTSLSIDTEVESLEISQERKDDNEKKE